MSTNILTNNLAIMNTSDNSRAATRALPSIVVTQASPIQVNDDVDFDFGADESNDVLETFGAENSCPREDNQGKKSFLHF
jgi:hypothetical protein